MKVKEIRTEMKNGKVNSIFTTGDTDKVFELFPKLKDRKLLGIVDREIELTEFEYFDENGILREDGEKEIRNHFNKYGKECGLSHKLLENAGIDVDQMKEFGKL